MPNVIISADSTCDLSPEQREHYQVRSFPFHIEFRGRDHLDNIDITPQVLFDGFYEDKSLPQTGACSPEAYRQHFAELTADGSKVVHFNLGSALSSAYENASAAAADMEGVYVIDGKSLSTGIGLQVLAACRMRDAGMSAADIAREASELHNRSHASFVLDTMEFLAAGGRCPTLVAYLGGKLSCRPGILVDNQSGAMKVGKLYRGKQEKVLERYVSDTLARYTDIVKDEIFITHSGVSDEVAAAVRKLLEERGFRTILHHHGQLHHFESLRTGHPRHPVHDRNAERLESTGREGERSGAARPSSCHTATPAYQHRETEDRHARIHRPGTTRRLRG